MRRAHVTEGSPHDNRLVPMLLVVCEDLLHGLHARILVPFVCLSGCLLVPVQNLIEFTVSLSKRVHDLEVLTRPTNGEIKVTPASAQATA